MTKPTSLNGHTIGIFLVQHEAAKQAKEMFEIILNTMTPEQINRFCFENGYSVPEPKEKK